jgi:UDP-N-acetylmuramate dehydrogenase
VNIEKNISLKRYNTFGIDVSAEYFAEFSSVEELKILLEESKTDQRLVIGGGSNILLTKNVQGFVLKNGIKGIELIKEDENYFYVRAYGGEVWHSFVLYCLQNNFAGVENLSLIPGSVGATPVQNIGAYGVELKDVCYELEALNTKDFSIQTFSSKDCKFGYRDSIFKREFKNIFIVLNVTFRLNKQPKLNIEYGAIRAELEKMHVQDISIQSVSQAVINIRRNKLPNPAITGNAGSFFKNPTIGEAHYLRLKEQYLNIPAYGISGSSDKKIAAGWLIEQCGWRGFREKNYGVHPLQALVLVNFGGATGMDIFNLSQRIIDSVKEKFAIALEREVNIV